MPEPSRVAPLHGLRQADLLIVAPFTLSESVRSQVSRLSGVTGAQPIEAAKVKVNGAYAAVLGVDPSTFRGYAVKPVASSDPLWQGVANGGIAVSYSMGTLNRLRLGGPVAVAGQVSEQLPVVAFGTVGIPGVDAVVSDTVARSLGMPAANAMVVSGSPATLNGLTKRIRTVLPKGAAVEQLTLWVSRPAGGASALVGSTAGNPAAGGSFLNRNQLVAVLQAALSRRGEPYVWGGSGPGIFDCSGLIQWSFAQAGLVMPRVAADQALTGPAVPAGQLAAGDLLFYRTDPTDPGYISHVAMYLGNGWMIQAPEPGRTVEVVPVDLGSEYAGAVRVDPPVASQLAGRIT
jgi:cell wall-associated NlpC family hydrolase